MIRARLSADGELMQRILASEGYYDAVVDTRIDRGPREEGQERRRRSTTAVIDVKPGKRYTLRSEEHTSELQSLMRISYAVFCLKKKKNKKQLLTKKLMHSETTNMIHRPQVNRHIKVNRNDTSRQ